MKKLCAQRKNFQYDRKGWMASRAAGLCFRAFAGAAVLYSVEWFLEFFWLEWTPLDKKAEIFLLKLARGRALGMVKNLNSGEV